MNETECLTLAASLRQQLHACAELPGHEAATRQLLIDFLKAHTTLSIHNAGRGFYAAHREACPCKPSIAFRADYDAVPVGDGLARHLCGHDGHSAALCAAALALEGASIGRNVFFLFQPEEEIGTGAASCSALFTQETIDVIYGCHNIPGFPLGQVITRTGTFACASEGLTLRFTGTPTHAAYPELGKNPAQSVARLLRALPGITDSRNYQSMTLCTVIGAQIGEKAFGSAACKAEIWLTLRSEQDDDLNRLKASILDEAKRITDTEGIRLDSESQDVFPATINDPECAQHILSVCKGQLLSEPMRWSEDFGHYLQQCRGAFFGIGAGDSCPGLHTANYAYPDALLQPTMRAFLSLADAP